MAGAIYVAKDSIGLARYIEEQYLDGSKGVLLLGERGIGKTEFAKYIAKIIFDKHYGRVALGINKPTREAIREAVGRFVSRGNDITDLTNLVKAATVIPKETKAVYNIVRLILGTLRGETTLEETVASIKENLKDVKQYRYLTTEQISEIAEIDEPADVIYTYLKSHAYFIINASQTLPEDLHWVFPDKERGEVIHVPLPIPPYSVVIIDEITNARPEMLSFLLTFILNKMIGNQKYEGIFFIATGNRPTQSELASSLPVPMLERFAIIDFPFPGRKALLIADSEKRNKQVREDFNELIALFDTILPYDTGGWRELVLHAFYEIVNSHLFNSANLHYIGVIKPYSEDTKEAMVRLPSPRSWEQFLRFVITHLRERNGNPDENVLKLEFQSVVLTNKDEADKFVRNFIAIIEDFRAKHTIETYAKVESVKKQIAEGSVNVDTSIFDKQLSATPLMDAYSVVIGKANETYTSYVFRKRYFVEGNNFAKKLVEEGKVPPELIKDELELEVNPFTIDLSGTSSFVFSMEVVEGDTRNEFILNEEIEQIELNEDKIGKKRSFYEIFERIFKGLE